MIEVDLRPKYDFLKYKNILPVPILGRLSRLQVVEIGGELNLAGHFWRRFDHEWGSEAG